jgi:hypothetical protein
MESLHAFGLRPLASEHIGEAFAWFVAERQASA